METHLLQLWGVKALFKVRLLTVSSHGGRGEGVLSSFFYRALISFIRGLTSGPNHFPKAPPPTSSRWALGFQHEFWEGDKHSDQSSH